MAVSVLVLTLNEEVSLPGCLRSLAWSDDVVVLDSLSHDRTTQVAKAAGARVIQRNFDNWASHQNWAVEHIPFKHPWVYYSDADERVSSELAQEVLRVVSEHERKEVAYRVHCRHMLMGRWLEFACGDPLIVRLFRPEKIRWERLVNPAAVVDGPVGTLRSHFEHYSFSKGFAEWLAKHNRYSDGEARELLASAQKALDWSGLRAADPGRRRQAWKRLAYRLPLRPLVVFTYRYFVRLGLLDGRAGLTWCILRAIYEYLIDIKVMELRRLDKGLGL